MAYKTNRTNKANRTYRTNKTYTTYLPIALSIILILAALVYFLSRPKKIDKQIDGLAGTIDTVTLHPSDVMIRFSREYNGIKFQDALNFTQKEYDALTKEEIIKMEDERFNNWVKLINGGN